MPTGEILLLAVRTGNPTRLTMAHESRDIRRDGRSVQIDLVRRGQLRSRTALQAENLVLRRELNVLVLRDLAIDHLLAQRSSASA